jgi:hypothetical protein
MGMKVEDVEIINVHETEIRDPFERDDDLQFDPDKGLLGDKQVEK